MTSEAPFPSKPSFVFTNLLLGFLVVMAVPFLFVDVPNISQYRLVPFIWNIGHIFLFFVLVWLALNTFRQFLRFNLVNLLITINIVVFLLSLVIEEIQYIYGREYSIDDIYKNCLGSSLAILFHPKIASDTRRVKTALQALTVLTLLVALYPLAKNTIDWFYGRFNFPVLSNFETPFEKERWAGQDLTVLKLESNNHALGNTFDTARYSTLAFTHFPNPWHGYYCFKYRVYNPYSNKVRLTTRINDRLHNETGRNFNDRFKLSLDVLPGWNHYAIDIDEIRSAPRTRLMDMSKVQEIMFFTSDLKTGATLYFDDLELSNDKSQCTALKNP